MSPIPRFKAPSTDDNGVRRLRTRLDLLIALLVLQIILSIGIWIDLPNGDENDQMKEIKTETIEQPVVQDETTLSPAKGVDQVADRKVSEKMPSEQIDWTNIRIDVLNGCGVKGLARRSEEWMKRNGMFVRLTENADRQDYPQTFIQDRSGNLEAALKLAEMLNISEDQVVRLEGSPSPYVDLTLVIGRDYKRLPIDN